MTAPGSVPGQPCAACGPETTGRQEQVQYCSDACRHRGPADTGRELEQAVTRLLAARASGATICPSEAARAVGGDDWRDLMEPARAAARRLVAAGQAEITQGGRVVDPSTARGPIRVRRRDPG